MSNLLDEIGSPEDVHKLTDKQLNVLSGEIRDFLIEKVSKTGGHLASSLGVVELTLSLYRSFNLEKDKLIWDVGHQSYVHKILTGRKEGFDTLRQFNGMSGFPKRSESKYDAFGVGHSSTSISAAIGMARARDIRKEDYDVVAVIGDGALTGGMAMEALNDIGYKKTNMIVVINDNQMSISKNVGAISKHLNKLRVEPGYNKFKDDVNQALSGTNTGKKVANSIHKIKDSVKNLVVPSMMFENMGLKYVGPIDGHDIKLMNEVFSKAKHVNGPVVIHVITKKGKGYEFAEKNPNKFHGIGPFDLKSGENNCVSKKSYSKVFGESMVELAKEDPNVVAITAAMPDGTGLNEFAKEYPDRFFDVGIAEEHATTLAAGMASAGLKPVFAVYSTFLQRAYDQMIHDVCIQKLPVVFAIDRAGIVGDDGETHQGVFDLSYLSMMPNLTVLAPKHMNELPCMLRWAVSQDGPVAIRYPRGGDSYNALSIIKNIKYGKWERIIDGKDIAIIAVGKMVQHTMMACDELKKLGYNPTVINGTFIKPLDTEMLKDLVDNNYDIITVEDNVLSGGFGSNVLMELQKLGFKNKFKPMGYDDEFIPHGSVCRLYQEYKLDSDGIKEAVLAMYKKEYLI